MVWMKEEIEEKEKLFDVVRYVFSMFHISSSVEGIGDVVDNISVSLPQQVDNPVISYTWYLLFEELFLQGIVEDMLFHGGVSVPLWIYKYGSKKFKKIFEVGENGEKYYSMLLSDSSVLDAEGEFGEFVRFIQDFKPNFQLQSEKDFFEEMKGVIINPDWRGVLGDSSVWNRRYDVDDWLNHAVL